MARTDILRSAGLLVLVLLLAAAGALSIMVGSKDVPLSAVWSAPFADQTALTNDEYIVMSMRLPRTVVGIAVGAALGVAGALIQALTRNPLADPGILGVNAGAALSITLGIGVLGVTSISGYVWFAFAGALVMTVAVYLIGSAGRGTADPLRLTLAGVALGAVVSGITTALTLLDPETFDGMRHWAAGSLENRSFALLLPILPFIVVGLGIAVVVARPLNSVALGDELAASLGVNVVLTRVLVLVAVTLLAGAATAIAGPIGFVGLMVPHIARWLVGPDQRWIVPYTVAMAPVLVLLADVFGRLVVRPNEIEVGIVTAFVGAPVLIALVHMRRKVSEL